MLPVLALVAVFALSGCGGGDNSNGPATSATTTSAEADTGSGEGQGETVNRGEGKSPSAKQGDNNAPQSKAEPEPGITPQQRRNATTASIRLETSSFKPGSTLPAKYTCDGEDVWPTLRWTGLPSEAKELVLLVLSVRPANSKLFFGWAVGGLDPDLDEIEEGKLPADAVVGENSFGKGGYSLCPEPGTSENYIFMLFAIPEALDPEPGFEPRQLREEVLAESGSVGLLGVKYKRE